MSHLTYINKRRSVCFIILATVALVAAGCAPGVDKPNTGPEAIRQSVTPEAAASDAIIQKTCPVMGGPINPELFVEYKGRKVYFCCSGCIDKFKADPEKYMAKLPPVSKTAPAKP